MTGDSLPIPLLPQLADFWQSDLMEKFRVTVEHWSGCVAPITQWEQEHLLESATVQDLKDHKQAVERMILFGRLISLSTTHPEFPDRRLAGMVRATLQAYEDKLAMWHGRMTDQQRETVLKEVFGES